MLNEIFQIIKLFHSHVESSGFGNTSVLLFKMVLFSAPSAFGIVFLLHSVWSEIDVYWRRETYNLFTTPGFIAKGGLFISLDTVNRIHRSPGPRYIPLSTYCYQFPSECTNATFTELFGASYFAKFPRYENPPEKFYFSADHFTMDPRCIEMLKTNIVLSTECTLPPGCGEPSAFEMNSTWYGTGYWVCYSPFPAKISGRLWKVSNTISTFPFKGVGGKFSTFLDFPFYYVYDPHTKNYGALSMAATLTHPIIRNAAVQLPTITQVGVELCLDIENRDEAGEMFWSDSPFQTLLEMDPIIVLTGSKFQPSQISCNYSEFIPSFSSKKYTFRMRDPKLPVLSENDKYCRKLVLRDHLLPDTYRCYPIVISYSDPLTKYMIKIVSFIIHIVENSLEYIFKNFSQLIVVLLESVGNLSSSVLDTLNTLFGELVPRFLVILVTIYIYDTKFVRDVVVTTGLICIYYCLKLLNSSI